MRPTAIVTLLAANVWISAAVGQTASPISDATNQDVFCQGVYALCIKALCRPVPTIDRLGNYAYDRVSCSCEIESGWSMGPGQCADRVPVKKGDFTYMISTYSNLFNRTNATLSCHDEHTTWAWCYGAPCVADSREADAGKGTATCTCPIEHGPMQTLGGDCADESCNAIWSAARPAADNIANRRFAEFMQEHGYPHNPPAQMCANITRSPEKR